MQQYILPIESIQESDINSIIFEDLATDSTFCVWFINELSLPQLTSVNGIWKNISVIGLEETITLFSYQSNKEKIHVLIKNKLDSVWQEKQYLKCAKNMSQPKNVTKLILF